MGTTFGDAFRSLDPERESDFVPYEDVTWNARGSWRPTPPVSLELFTDFFWDITQLYYTYDSDPSREAIARDDYGIVSALRYKW